MIRIPPKHKCFSILRGLPRLRDSYLKPKAHLTGPEEIGFWHHGYTKQRGKFLHVPPYFLAPLPTSLVHSEKKRRFRNRFWLTYCHTHKNPHLSESASVTQGNRYKLGHSLAPQRVNSLRNLDFSSIHFHGVQKDSIYLGSTYVFPPPWSVLNKPKFPDFSLCQA